MERTSGQNTPPRGPLACHALSRESATRSITTTHGLPAPLPLARRFDVIGALRSGPARQSARARTGGGDGNGSSLFSVTATRARSRSRISALGARRSKIRFLSGKHTAFSRSGARFGRLLQPSRMREELRPRCRPSLVCVTAPRKDAISMVRRGNRRRRNGRALGARDGQHVVGFKRAIRHLCAGERHDASRGYGSAKTWTPKAENVRTEVAQKLERAGPKSWNGAHDVS